MFQTKTIAAFALLATVASAARDSEIHIRSAKNHHKQELAPDGQCSNGGQSVSVVSWSLPGCIDAGVDMCVAGNSAGACPEGAHCDVVAWDASGSEIYGCLPGEWEPCYEPSECPDGQTPVSVVGWTESGCVEDDPNDDYDICVAGNYWGKCPEGSACGWVTWDDTTQSDVYGCYDMYYTYTDDSCVPVSVVGWEYNGCISEDDEANMCVADNSAGVCPDGSYCDVVEWIWDDASSTWSPNVYGCIDNYYNDYDDSSYAAYQAPCDEGYDEIGVVGWSSNGCVPSGSDVCVASKYDGVCAEYSTCQPVAWDDEAWDYVYGCVGDWVEARHMTHKAKAAHAKAHAKAHTKPHHKKTHHSSKKTHHSKKSHQKKSHQKKSHQKKHN